MSEIELLNFQQEAANRLVETAVTYYKNGADRIGGKTIPFVGQLKAVTGAGKTPILATVVSKLKPSIILWTTKFGSVVDQTAINLRPNGKYYHLLGNDNVQVIKLSEIPSFSAWQKIIEQEVGITILISTVAAWNSSEKDDRLNVHRVNPDWGDKSRWDQLKLDRKRPLWVVYDEAHNQTTEQVELLDDLDPAGFFVASASPVKGKLLQYLSNLPEELRKIRIVPVSTRAVVDAQLLKSVISLMDYDSPAEEMITDAASMRKTLEQALSELNAPFKPKAIYVVETSNISKSDEDPRPVSIWKTLVNQCGISPENIAVCTNTKNLPKDVIRVQAVEHLSEQFTHIIFNKKLQEGWDDPTVYICYFDGKTDSAVRIQQVIGRAMRQPQAKHFTDNDLNTAYFFVNCPNDRLEIIIDDLKEELRIYKDEDGDNDKFEPFEIKEQRRALPKIPLKPEWVGKLKAPRFQLELPDSCYLQEIIKGKTFAFDDDDRSSPGKALINVVSVRTGDVEQRTRDLLEDMRVKCGVYLQEQIRALSKNCLNSIHPDTFTNEKLDKLACYKSRALLHYHDVAIEVVREYEARIQLTEFSDPTESSYIVGPYQPNGNAEKSFQNAGHPNYDTRAFNQDELEMAKALDSFDSYVWVRNRQNTDYGIPLPSKSGASHTFYPDFLWWVKDTVWAIDPTGRIFLDEKIRSKLLIVPQPLKIALVTRGKYDSHYGETSTEGWSLTHHHTGIIGPENYDNLKKLLSALVSAS